MLVFSFVSKSCIKKRLRKLGYKLETCVEFLDLDSLIDFCI
jgi:hypothetical protein